jgi:nucleotide-binding universal stress UspA family protein
MYERILAPTDGSETSLRALHFALQTARETGAELVPLYIVDVPLLAYDAPGVDSSIARDAFLEEGQRLKADCLAAMRRAGVNGTPRVVELDEPGTDIAQRILQEAIAIHADLVVMGTHGRRGFRRLMLGSVADRFLRISHCPVLLVPPDVESTASSHVTACQPEKESS